ncbi:MAG: Gfo/Idh/MocA family oxidoreductase [Planctomycetales bacterium]|nr:Gfo/Idh/MocA family oxidoreductase [Planctomycetales bacterium]
MSKIRIGQIGTGHGHAAGKMAVFRASNDYEVVGVVESDPRLRATAKMNDVYDGVPWMSEAQLLETPGLQAVAIETNVAGLLDAAEKAVAAGCHVHLDKPAGASLPRYQALLDEASRKHLLVQMGYMYRYNPAVVMLHDFLDRGWLGEPFELHAVMSKVVSPSSRRPLAAFEGGMMFELGCHLIDLVVGVLGEPDEVTPYVQHVSSLDDGLNDNMLAVLTYPQAMATVKSSGVEVEGFDRRHLVVCGTEGTFHMQPLDAPNVRVAFAAAHGDYRRGYQDITLGDYDRYVADAADMARIIRGEKDPDYSYDHDLRVQRTVLRACGMPLD